MRKRWIVAALLFVALIARAQVAVNLLPTPRQQFRNVTTDAPLAGGCVFTYQAGTSTPQATYTDATGLVVNSNPIILDANGYPTASGAPVGIWIQQLSYKIAVFSAGGVNCASGVQQWTLDSVSATQLSTANTWSQLQTFNGGIKTSLPLSLTQGGFTNTLTAAVTAARAWQFPDANGTVVLPTIVQTWSAAQTFSSGINTDTINGSTASTMTIGGVNSSTGNGEGVQITGGSALAGNNVGGQITLLAGGGFGNGQGGNVSVSSGPGGAASGNGGNMSIIAGNGGAGASTGGNVILSPGSGSSTNGTVVVNRGISPSAGTGFQAIRSTAGCATAAAAGSVCTTVVTWALAFPNTNYTPDCTGFGITSGVPLNGGLTAITAASVTFQTVSGTAAAAQFTNIICKAIHD